MGSVLALALLGALAARVLLGYPRPARPAQVLSRAELATLEAVAEVLLPKGGAIPPSGLEAGVPGYTDRLLAASHPRMRWLMHLLFFLVEHATLVFPAPGGRRGWRRFSALGREQRAAVLEGWRTSRLFPRRLVFASLRAILHDGLLRLSRRCCASSGSRPTRSAPRSARPISGIRGSAPRAAASALSRADLTPPSDGTPIPLDAPLHPAYRKGAR